MAEIEGDSNWVVVQLEQRGGVDELKISGASLSKLTLVTFRGKWYDVPNKDQELSSATINSKKVPDKGILDIGSCGRQNSPSGCNGSFDVKDKNNKQVCKIRFAVPYGAIHKCEFTVDAANGWLAPWKLLDKDKLGNGGPNAYIGRVSVKILED
ncbi:unnamed protein product [Clonostachys chloroleuca]|uniref:Uncharacterized protein n=1 Tax=Clonostachys chloroleuca TaxID=1926264 RepID=A0AA35M6J2_9HYPO|nr:unnamed protein product [Clonostachys chloroleuca]